MLLSLPIAEVIIFFISIWILDHRTGGLAKAWSSCLLTGKASSFRTSEIFQFSSVFFSLWWVWRVTSWFVCPVRWPTAFWISTIPFLISSTAVPTDGKCLIIAGDSWRSSCFHGSVSREWEIHKKHLGLSMLSYHLMYSSERQPLFIRERSR